MLIYAHVSILCMAIIMTKCLGGVLIFCMYILLLYYVSRLPDVGVNKNFKMLSKMNANICSRKYTVHGDNYD